MTGLLATNRAMFWRIIRRLLSANRGRLFVMLLALGAGSAVTAALLNLQVDAKRRLTAEFRAFGANVVIAPKEAIQSLSEQRTLPESYYRLAPTIPINEGGKSALLYVLARASTPSSDRGISVIVAGSLEEGFTLNQLPFMKESTTSISHTEPNCWIGGKFADQLGVHVSDRIFLRTDTAEETCRVVFVFNYGTDEDNQVSVNLETAQRLAALPGRISLIRLRVPGPPRQIQQTIADLQGRFPDADVRPIRQFTEGEAKIYNRISRLLTATVGIVLLLTALCVMAAMTNVAMERKMDVGLMKAIGGATRRVLRLFLVEAALLGLAGGLIGAAAGIFLSIGLGKAVFGVAARPRLIVYPVAVALTVIVAILSAFPLRRLASIRPASVFRGEA